MSLVEITVASLKEAAAKLPPATKEKPLSAIDEGIRKGAQDNAGGKVTVPCVTADRVNELLGVEPETENVSAETQGNLTAAETPAKENPATENPATETPTEPAEELDADA